MSVSNDMGRLLFVIEIDTNVFNEKMEEINGKFDEIITKLGIISENTRSSIENPFVDSVGILTGLITMLDILGVKFELVIESIGTAFGPTGIAIAATVLLIIASFALLYTKCEGFRDKTNKTFELMMLPLSHFWEQNGSGIMTSFGQMFSAIGDFFEQLKVLFQGFWEIVGPIFIAKWAVISAAISSFFSCIGSYVKSSLGVITSIISAFTILLTGDWDGLWKHLKSSFSIWNDFFIKTIGFLFGSIPGLVKSKLTMLSEVIADNMGKIKDIFTSPFKTLSEKFREIGKLIILGLIKGTTEEIGSFKKTVREMVKAILGIFNKDLEIHSPSKKMMEIGKFIILGLINGLKGAVQGVLTFVGEFVTNVIGWVTTSVPMVISAVVTLFDTVWTGIINIHSKFLNIRDLAGVFM